jgi:hypothetical protein
VFISKRMGYPRILHVISVLQADNIPCFYQRLSCDPTANLADKGTLSLVGYWQSTAVCVPCVVLAQWRLRAAVQCAGTEAGRQV